MMELFVRSLPLKDVIANLAEEMKTSYDKNCNEYILNIPAAYGKGLIRGINFTLGFGLIEYNCFFKEEVSIHFSLNNIHPLKFIYCSEGFLKHRFEEKEDIHQIDQFQNVVVSSSSSNGHVLIFPRNIHIRMNSLEINRTDFKTKIDCDIDNLDRRLRSVFKDLRAKHLFYYHGNYSLAMAKCIQDINSSKQTGFARRLLLEGKANEILSIQIQDFEDDQQNDSRKKILRKADLKQIEHAVKILKEELANPITIKDLAKTVGTNTTKLQEGFQHMFGLSVNNYLRKLRLEFARDQLILGELNISEIAEQIGIINKSYFSRIFKEAYGLNPKELSQQIKSLAKKHRSIIFNS